MSRRQRFIVVFTVAKRNRYYKIAVKIAVALHVIRPLNLPYNSGVVTVKLQCNSGYYNNSFRLSASLNRLINDWSKTILISNSMHLINKFVKFKFVQTCCSEYLFPCAVACESSSQIFLNFRASRRLVMVKLSKEYRMLGSWAQWQGLRDGLSVLSL